MSRPPLHRLVVALLALAVLAPAAAAAAPSDARLLRTYQPVAVLDPQERFRPTKVQPFVRDSVLERFDGTTWVVADPDPEPETLPGPGTGVWRLNQQPCVPSAFLGGLECYATAAGHGAGGDGVYGRVVRTGGATVLQYWFFYYDNTWSYTYPASDLVWQAHEGDWETVNVVLGPDAEPAYVGYSRHCLGRRRAWEDVERRGTHPVVYVAVGSHANYFAPGEFAWDAACVPPQAQALLAQLGLGLPRDRTGAGEVAGPPRTGGSRMPLHVLDDNDAWVRFPGFWGELEYLHAPLVGTVPFGTGPLGPAYKPIWHDPVAAMAAWPAG